MTPAPLLSLRAVCLALAMTAAVTTGPLHAAEPPAPARKTEALQELNSRLEQERSREAEMKKKTADAESALDTTRKDMTALSAEIQSAEQTLTALETQMAKARSEHDVIKSRLERDYGSISELILALQRIRRTPTETLILRPGAPLETAQSAMLLESILPTVNARAEQLSADLNRLNELQATLESDRAKAREGAATLQSRRKELQAMLNTRETLYRQSQTDYKTQTESVARMASEAKNLRELMAKIEAESRAETNRNEPTHKSTRNFRKDKTPLPRAGTGRLPVAGMVLVGFGETDDIGAKSEGLRLQTRNGALVSAPMGGIVRFAGVFKNYGNMVIVEHEKGYHSLVAGMARIDTVVGRRLNAGEPIGSMAGNAGGGDGPVLYYELRRDGKPVDPSKKIPGLS